MSTHNFAIWASKNTDEGFTLQILPSPRYLLVKSFASRVQNILDFKRVVGRDWKPCEGCYLCYFDKGSAKVGSTVGSMTDEGITIWYDNTKSKIIDPSLLNQA